MYGGEEYEQGAKSGFGIAKKAGSAAGQGAKKVYSLLPPKAKIIVVIALFLFILIYIVVGSASVVMNRSLTLNPTQAERESYTASSEDSRELTKEDILTRIGVIEAKQSDSYTATLSELKKFCKKNDVEYDLSMQCLQTAKEAPVYVPKEVDYNKVIGTITLKNASDAQKEGYIAKKESEYPVSDTIKAITSKYHKDEKGYLRYSYPEGEDYIIAAPESFGSVGERVRITTDKGKRITAIIGNIIPAEHTYDKKGEFASESCIFYFIAADDAWPSVYENSKSLLALDGNKIFQIEKTESDFIKTMTLDTGSDLKILSAFSVSIANGQLWNINNKFYDVKGTEIEIYLTQDGQIDYETTLQKKLDAYKGSYYTLDYQRSSSGEIIYKYKEEKIEKHDYLYDPATGEIIEDIIYYEIIKHYYVHPIITEKNLYEICLDIFELDADAPYVNSCEWVKSEDGTMVPSGSYITNQKAIDDLAETTSKLVFDNKIGTGEISHTEYSGQFEWPVPGCNRITCRYGMRVDPITGKRSMHNAIDIGCSKGSKAVSPENGTVVKCSWTDTGGYRLTIKLDNGFTAQYQHLQEFLVEEGQRVAKGETVALTGNTGSASTGPHLHFSIINEKGKYEDPLYYVVSDYSKLKFLD